MASIAWDYLTDLQKAQIAKLRPDIYNNLKPEKKDKKPMQLICLDQYQRVAGDESLAFCHLDDRCVEDGRCNSCDYREPK